jgi:hypothetical protein
MDSRIDIIETLTRLFWTTDHHDWDGLGRVFDHEVTLDYTAAAGGDPAVLTPEQIVAAWKPTFDALDAHQHLVGNYLIEQGHEEAHVSASFIATHQHGGQTWTLGGDYRFTLRGFPEGWKVTAMTMLPIWQTGPVDLIEQALKAAAAK